MGDAVDGSRADHPKANDLLTLVQEASRAGQLPSVHAATFETGEIAWRCTLGASAGEGAQYRIGSISKTFTAALVMRLRDEGRLGLDDPLGRHLPDAPYARHTIRRLLSHSAGITAEPKGPWWERSPGASWPALAAANQDAPQIFAPGQRYHYSNLGFGLLGQLVADARGTSWFDAVRSELLDPLDLGATTYGPHHDAAVGTSRDPRTGRLVGEPAQDTGAMAAAGQLWSTVADLARWADFLAAGRPDVLQLSSLLEMRTVTSGDPDTQHIGAYGLGLRLRWHESGTFVGHSGSMPGFLAALLVHPDSRVGAVVLANATSGLDAERLAALLLDTALDAGPPTTHHLTGDTQQQPRVVDEGALALEGDWHWGNTAMRLHAIEAGFELVGDASRRTFARTGEDGFVGLDGYFAGEQLMVVRRPDGTVSHLEVVTFVLTREPYDPTAPIPGGPPTQLA